MPCKSLGSSNLEEVVPRELSHVSRSDYKLGMSPVVPIGNTAMLAPSSVQGCTNDLM